MSLRAAVAVLLLMVSSSLPAGALQGSEPDWLLVRIEAGPEPIDGIRAGVSGTALASGDEPTVAGFGYADPFAKLVDVVPLGSGPLAVTTAAGAGGIEVVVIPSGPGGARQITATLIVEGVLASRSAVSFLVFVPGMHFTSLHIEEPTTASGTLSWRSWTGTGSSTARAAAPGDGGTGGAVGPAAAAIAATHTREVDRGLVGAFVSWNFCVICWSSWSSPSGTAGTYSTPNGQGSSVFAGPAGLWTWTWSGAGVTQTAGATAPVVLAFAPVDDIWPIFAPLPGA